MDDLLNDILRAADKHPNSRVSKLIRTVEEDPSQKNIVLLLIELSDHAEYATDFNISLRYYLELFERLGIDRDLILNEAGLLLVNSTKIYSKRVDYVQSLVERQIMTLSNADQEIQQQKEQNLQESTAESVTPAEKPKRGRKRALDAPTDPYEVQLEPKKFKKMTQEKRFALPKTPMKSKSLLRNIEVEQQIHPAGWMHATIYDLENDEEVDTKRNYKLFTYHIEHRYNTLVPDINFRLHFKVKDYMDAQEEEMDDGDDVADPHNQEWPPLSEEYIQKYINLENHVLQQEIDPSKSWNSPSKLKNCAVTAGTEGVGGNEDVSNKILDESTTVDMETSLQNSTITNDSSCINDSGMGTSLLSSSIDTTQLDNTCNDSTMNNTSLSETDADKSRNLDQTQGNDSALGESLLDQTNNSNETVAENSPSKPSETGEATQNAESEVQNEIISTETTNAGSYKEAEDAVTGTESKDAEICTAESKDGGEGMGNTSEITEIMTENETSTPAAEINGSSVTATEKETFTIAENNADEVMVSGQNEGDIPAGSDKTATDGEECEPIAEDGRELQTDTMAESAQSVGDNTKDDAVIQLEIHVMRDNEKEPSERLQLQISCTDDEGVHLSDVYEDDFQMLSPTIKLPNVMPGIKNKDVTIYLDEELREALELRDGMMEHFSQETYNVPVIEEPKEQPILFNILQLPPKLLRKKILFKMGPEMDLFVKARSLKPTRTSPPAREYRFLKQLQFFPLNNTDMTGITNTPHNSPGHSSDFCGFTDDELEQDESTTFTEFCGFTEDEQSNLVLNTHRLSRDSGVGVDAANLTPEKERLETIFEENSGDVANCKVNFNKEFLNSENSATNALASETAEELLNDLPASIRNALEAEIQDTAIDNVEETTKDNTTEHETTTTTEATAENDPDKNKVEQVPTEELNSAIAAMDTNQASGVENRNDELDESTNNEITQKQEYSSIYHKENSATMPEDNKSVETDKESEVAANSAEEQKANQYNTLDNDTIAENQTKEVPASYEADGHCEDVPVSKTGGEDSIRIGLENDSDYSDSSQDNALFDLNLQGTKTKIQQWHEHLRPILTKSKERHHFDVFQMGTEIIDTIQSADAYDLNVPATFGDIMHNKDKSYVSRYFLSTLLLANQSNVNVVVENKSSESPSSWSDIKLKLLSTKRHTVAIEDNIGMINNKKRKQKPPNEDNIKKKKINASNLLQDSDGEESLDESEPLVNLQTSMNKTKGTPTKRAPNCDTSGVEEKKFRGPDPSTTSAQQTVKSKECLRVSQERLPQLDMPTTSWKVKQNLANCEVNLNNIRILQPIEKVPRQGDDYDSGIFSIGEMSTS